VGFEWILNARAIEINENPLHEWLALARLVHGILIPKVERDQWKHRILISSSRNG
jgi:hypothetical protein